MENADLRAALNDGIRECMAVSEIVAGRMLACADSLRINPDADALGALGQLVEDLRAIDELVGGIGAAASSLGLRADIGWALSAPIFGAMGAAFERGDWVSVADVLQYELHPVLVKSCSDLGGLK